MYDQYYRATKEAIKSLLNWPSRQVRVFHHNDCDGLSSATILSKAFSRKDYKVNRYCLEKPYPAVLKKIFLDDGCINVFADFGGRAAPIISELNGDKNLSLILDHHYAVPSTNPKVYNLDPELFGFRGDREMSASTTCYMFSKILDPNNVDLAHLAVIGAVGDGLELVTFYENGRLVSKNQEAVMDAVKQGTIEIKKETGREKYIVKAWNKEIACDELGPYLDVLGAVGYYQDGPELGVDVCINGMSDESNNKIALLKEVKERIFREELNSLKNGALKQTEHIQWFHVGDRFVPMGVKMVGLFCKYIRTMDFMNPDKYIAGFQIIPDQIPGFGAIGFNDVKVSMRVPDNLISLIKQEKAMALNKLLPMATHKIGGFTDACHTISAATTIAIGREETLIKEMENLLVN